MMPENTQEPFSEMADAAGLSVSALFPSAGPTNTDRERILPGWQDLMPFRETGHPRTTPNNPVCQQG